MQKMYKFSMWRRFRSVHDSLFKKVYIHIYNERRKHTYCKFYMKTHEGQNLFTAYALPPKSFLVPRPASKPSADIDWAWPTPAVDIAALSRQIYFQEEVRIPKNLRKNTVSTVKKVWSAYQICYAQNNPPSALEKKAR